VTTMTTMMMMMIKGHYEVFLHTSSTGYSYVSLITSTNDNALNVQSQHFVTLSDFLNTRLRTVTVTQTGCFADVNSNISFKESFNLQLNNMSAMYQYVCPILAANWANYDENLFYCR
jgi:hypothetical protein